MDILNALKQLRDDLRLWVTVNLNALNAKIDEKTIPIDNKLDIESTNPVQNKVIANAINNIPRFSGDYNDLTNAPNIAEDDSGNMVIADESGNVIFRADSDGIHTTAITLDGKDVEDVMNDKIDAHDTDEASHQDIRGAISTLSGLVGDETVAWQIDQKIDAIKFPETDLSNYYDKDEINDAIEGLKSDISESIVSESDEWKVVDDSGNIIFSVDDTGAHTTAMTLNGKSVATEEYVGQAISGITVPDVDGKITTHNNAQDSHADIRKLIGDESVEWQIGKKLESYYDKDAINQAIAGLDVLTEQLKSEIDNKSDINHTHGIISNFMVDAVCNGTMATLDSASLNTAIIA